MNTIRIRAKDQLPVVLLTLLSIVQALALELLWDHVSSVDYLYESTWPALIGWMQVTASFMAILLIWLLYSSSVMRFRWVPATIDSVFPFLIGIIEFTLIAQLGPDRIGGWFLVLALVFAVMTWVSHVSYRRARLDEENEEFFSVVQPARFQDFLGPAASIVLLTLCGLFFLMSGYTGWIAFTALLAVSVLMLYQMYRTDYFCRISMLQS